MNTKEKRNWFSWSGIKLSITQAEKWAFFSAIIWGLIAHIPAISNDILNHDAISNMNPDSAKFLASQGKWAAGTIVAMLRGALSTPSWFVTLGIVFFALSAVMIVRMFGIKSRWCAACVGAILVVYDTVASMTLAYGTDYFAFCFLLSVAAAFIARRWKFGAVLSIPVLGICVAAYQPLIGVTAALLVLCCVQDCFASEKKLRKVFLQGLIYICVIIAGGIMYYGILQLLIDSSFLTLSNYRGVDSISPVSFTNMSLCWRLLKETIAYVYDEIGGKHSEPYAYMKTLYPVFGGSALIAVVISIIKNRSYRNWGKLIGGLILLLLVFPLAANIVDFITIDNYLSRIMRYSFIIVFLAPIIIVGWHRKEADDEREIIVQIHTLTERLLVGMSAILILNWGCLTHDIYNYVYAANRQMFAKVTCVMSSIYDCDGYTTEASVVLVGTPYYPFFSDTGSMTAERKAVNLKYGTQGVYSANDIFYASRLLKSCLNDRLGANFTFADENQYYAANSDYCDSLPVYPNEDSIVFDKANNVIVVKLSEVK